MKQLKYNLTTWQKFSLNFLYPIWYFTDSSQRKPWHLVKKGMENHNCNFTVIHYERLEKFLKCEHEGCNTCIPIKTTPEEHLERRKILLSEMQLLLTRMRKC